MSKPRFDHLPTTLCWCAPQRFEQEEYESEEIFPGIFQVTTYLHVMLYHVDNSLAPRAHGKPRKIRYRQESL